MNLHELANKHAVLKLNLEEVQKYTEKINRISEERDWTRIQRLSNERDNYHYSVSGFLWGLLEGNLITEQEREKLFDELMEMQKGIDK